MSGRAFTVRENTNNGDFGVFAENPLTGVTELVTPGFRTEREAAAYVLGIEDGTIAILRVIFGDAWPDHMDDLEGRARCAFNRARGYDA